MTVNGGIFEPHTKRNMTRAHEDGPQRIKLVERRAMLWADGPMKQVPDAVKSTT